MYIKIELINVKVMDVKCVSELQQQPSFEPPAEDKCSSQSTASSDIRRLPGAATWEAVVVQTAQVQVPVHLSSHLPSKATCMLNTTQDAAIRVHPPFENSCTA